MSTCPETVQSVWAEVCHALAAQAAADLYAAQERAVLKEYHVILKKIMNQVQTRAALQMQAAAQMGAAAAGGYRSPMQQPGMQQPQLQHQQQQQQFAQQFQQHAVPGAGLLPPVSGTAAVAAMGVTPTGPYPMQAQSFPMAMGGAGYSPQGPHAGGLPLSGPHVAGGPAVGLAAAMPVQQPMLPPLPDDAPMVTFKEEPASNNAAS